MKRSLKISINSKLYKKLEAESKKNGFDDVIKYIEFLLEKCISEKSVDEKELIRKRLKALGYL